jgi:hypothetical protein
MKKRIIQRTALLSLAFIVSALRTFSQADTTFHIYLMFGQSNMEGAGTIEAQDRVINPRVWMMQDSTCPNLGRAYGQWYPAAPPLSRCWGNLGPGDSFGRMLGEQVPAYVTKIGLINASVSGCNIFIYKKGCPNGLDQNSQGIPFACGYTWLLDLAKKAQQVGVIKGIIFHQGETNNTDPAWKYTVQQIIADLKSDLDLGDIPFLAGELLYAQYNSCCSAHNVEINKLPGIIPNAHVIPAAGLPGADNAHFTSASYRTFGERYARKMLELVYNVCDSTPIESWYNVNNEAEIKGSHIVISTGQTLNISPRPVNNLGTWSWSGAGTSGSSRMQTLTFEEQGDYNAQVVYTNECGTVSRLPITIAVCDSSLAESWYQVDNGEWIQSDSVTVLRGSKLILGPRASDTTGTWKWSGAGYGALPQTRINTSFAGKLTARATYTNSCGAKSRLSVGISVCDSTRIESWYQIDGGSPVKSNTITVMQHAVLNLSPKPETGGSWSWSGAGEGSSREQIISTEIPGTYTVSVIYANACGLLSHMKVSIVVEESTGMKDASDNNIEIYPNPANSRLNIKASDSFDMHTVIIMNDLGQTLINADPNKSGGQYSIDVSQLTPGIYYLKVKGSNRIIIRKFLKTK